MKSVGKVSRSIMHTSEVNEVDESIGHCPKTLYKISKAELSIRMWNASISEVPSKLPYKQSEVQTST